MAGSAPRALESLDVMKIAYAVAAVLIVVIALVLFVRSRTVPTYSVGTADLPRVLSALSASSAFPAYAMLTFSAPDQPAPDRVISLQFSLEHGQPGFEGVLYQPRNIEDEARFVAFARDRGFTPTSKELNDVRYLRVDRGDLVALCRSIITDLYAVPPSEKKLELIVEGFEWRP